MTVSELEKWATEKQNELEKGFAVDLADDSAPSYMLKLIADWRAMREALTQGIEAYDAGGLARRTLKELRLKP